MGWLCYRILQTTVVDWSTWVEAAVKARGVERNAEIADIYNVLRGTIAMIFLVKGIRETWEVKYAADVAVQRWGT